MRRNYAQPSHHHNNQLQGGFSDEKKIKEEIIRTNNVIEEIRNPSSSSHGAGAEKKLELSPAAETETETKKLERKSTEDINASADAFIKNFRQQLLIQRLQSIENYEQMLARGL